MKFLIKNFLLLIACSFLFINNVTAASNPYGKYQDLYDIKTVRCTWYAWEQAYKNAGVSLPGWGNAQTWYNSAIIDGYSVGKEAKANSIAVFSSSDGYGHVAYVVSVAANGKYMIVNEGGIPTQENEGIINGSHLSTNSSNLIGFIYLDDVPKKNDSSLSTQNNTTNNDFNKHKSNNNSLSDMSINIDDFKFDSKIFEYNLNVPYDTKIITIKATPEDDLAIVTGTGDKALNVGINTYTIKITAENGQEKAYIINITRKDNYKENNNLPIKTVTKVKSDNMMLFVFLGVIILLILGIIIAYFKKRKLVDNYD